MELCINSYMLIYQKTNRVEINVLLLCNSVNEVFVENEEIGEKGKAINK